MPNSLRLFYALWPDDATRYELMQLQALVTGRKTRLENLHLTLAFLGQQPSEQLPALKNILAALPRTPIPLVLNRVGYFPRNKIAWAGMHEIPIALTELHQSLTNALIQNRIAFDNKSTFKPHITLAREAIQPEELPFTPATWQAGKVVLVESFSENNSSTYRVLASQT
jgi:2'-5' RNA ligase